MSASRIPVKGLSPEVEAMVRVDGFYLLAPDKTIPNNVIPMMSMGGKVFTLIHGREIDPMRLLPKVKLSGPFLPTPDAKG